MRKLLYNQNLLFNRFTRLVETNHQVITERFMNDLLKNSDTVAYKNINSYVIYESSDKIYRDLSTWIARDYPKEKIKEKYVKLGRERYAMNIPFPQVQKAMTLQRRHLWLFIMDKLYDDKTAYMEAIQLNNRVTLYFDRATFFMLHGYQTELKEAMQYYV